MINISFVNIILIIAENTFGFGELGNPYFSAYSASDNPHYFTLIVFGSLYSFIFVKSSDSSNFMADFFTDILANSFNNFSMDGFSIFVIDLISFFAISFFFNLFVFCWFLQDDFSTLATNTFSALSQNVFPNNLFSIDFSLLLLLLSDNSTTF